MPRRESRGSQAPLIERMGAVLGPPRCFAKMDGGALFVWLCPPQWSLSKRRPGRGHSLKVNARPTTGSSALPAPHQPNAAHCRRPTSTSNLRLRRNFVTIGHLEFYSKHCILKKSTDAFLVISTFFLFCVIYSVHVPFFRASLSVTRFPAQSRITLPI